MSDRLFEPPRNVPQDDWRCSHCGEWKPENGRLKKGVSVDGTPKYATLCSICQNKHRQARRGPQADAFRAKKMIEQEGRCAGCKRHHTEFKDGLGIDHDHATGHRRALLCKKCNLGAGHGGDDPLLFDLLAAYCEAHAGRGHK